MSALRWSAVLFALLVLVSAVRAETPDELAKRVLENIKLSLARLDTVVGESRFSYAQPGQKAATHRVTFSFQKPFQFVIREARDSFQFAHHRGKVVLYFPRELDVLQFDLEDADAGVVRRLMSLLEVPNFTLGFGLAEMGAQFKVSVKQHNKYFETEIVPYANGVWRRVIGLHRIVVQLATDTYLPVRIQVFQRLRPPAPAALAFEMEVTKIAINVPVDEKTFKIELPAKVNKLGTGELVQFILGSSMKDGKDILQGMADEVTDRVKKFTNTPWDF